MPSLLNWPLIDIVKILRVRTGFLDIVRKFYILANHFLLLMGLIGGFRRGTQTYSLVCANPTCRKNFQSIFLPRRAGTLLCGYCEVDRYDMRKEKYLLNLQLFLKKKNKCKISINKHGKEYFVFSGKICLCTIRFYPASDTADNVTHPLSSFAVTFKINDEQQRTAIQEFIGKQRDSKVLSQRIIN